MLIEQKITIHWLLAGFAVSVFCLAALQAVLLTLQEKNLRNKHIVGIMKILPPLETMEIFLFRLMRWGFLLLNLLLITSWYFFSGQILTFYLLSKLLIILIAWIFFAILLIGRYWFGWRGKRVIYGTLSGIGLLIVIYIMSRLKRGF